MTETQAFRQPGGVDVHDHVDQCLDLCGSPGRPDVAQGRTHGREQRLGALERGGVAGTHEVERAIAGLGNAAGHAGFEALGTGPLGACFDGHVDRRRDRGTVDEQPPVGANEQAVAALGEDRIHRLIVGHNGQDGVGLCRYVGERGAGGSA